MLLDIVQKGVVDRSVIVRIIDSVDGTPETGVVFNTAGIDLWYRREGAALTAITEADLATLTTAHTDGGFKHIADGYYRLDLPDAAFATGANYVDVGGGVTGMVVIGGRVRLTDFSLESDVPPVNVVAINSSNQAAINLSASARTIYDGTVTGTSTTTTIVDSGLTQSGPDHFKGLIVKFYTGALALQGTDITAFTPGTDTLTVSPLTAAPSIGDKYSVL
jgi:hypothetical protein